MEKKEVRSKFREVVFSRDERRCRICGEEGNLDAHHITDRDKMPNGGYVKENGITLCAAHHLDAELFHISEGRQWKQGMHPDDLYKLICSSYKEALEASRNLKD